MSTLDTLSGIAYTLFMEEFAHCEPQQFTIPLNAVPASRPRVTQNAVHYGKNYTHFKEHAVGPCNAFSGRSTDKPVAVLLEHVVERTRKDAKRDYPKGDLDNYDKAPLDAMVKSGRFFKDDVQVLFMVSLKRYAEPGEAGCVHVTWFELIE